MINSIATDSNDFYTLVSMPNNQAKELLILLEKNFLQDENIHEAEIIAPPKAIGHLTKRGGIRNPVNAEKKEENSILRMHIEQAKILERIVKAGELEAFGITEMSIIPKMDISKGSHWASIAYDERGGDGRKK